MKVMDVNTGGLSMVETSHAGRTLAWDVSTYSRTSDRTPTIDVEHMFDEINAFWETMDRAKQDRLWEIYEKIYAVLQSITDVTSVKNQLQVLVRDMYEVISLDDIRHWLLYKSGIGVPSTIKTEYDENNTQESTYLREDYQDLLSLSIALRPMVPIWGEFIGASKKESGTYKEYDAMKLLYLSSITSSKPMLRLTSYVNARVNHILNDGTNATMVLSGLGTAEVPDWIRGITVVRRLAVNDIVVRRRPNDNREDNTDNNMVSGIYKFIQNTMRGLNKKIGAKFGGKVVDKSPNATSGDDSNNASLVENYKVKQEVADGDLVVQAVYTERYEEMIKVVDSTVPVDLMIATIDAVGALDNQRIYRGATALTQWVMAPCISAHAIELLPKPALLRCLAATQAILWHWEFYDLAALVTAVPQETRRDIMINSLESRSRIPKELLDELIVLYPHYQQGRAKQQSVRQVNVAYKAIDAFCDIITKHDWYLTAPEALVEKTSRIATTRKLFVPGDIRVQLARLIIKIAKERSQHA